MHSGPAPWFMAFQHPTIIINLFIYLIIRTIDHDGLNLCFISVFEVY